MLKHSVIAVLTAVTLTGCMGTRNDGYTEKDVWVKGDEIHARATATEKTENLCYNKARVNARDKISNYIVTEYAGNDKLTINEAKEIFASNRDSKTKSMMTGANYLLKKWDKKTKTCGVEMIISTDQVESLLGE